MICFVLSLIYTLLMYTQGAIRQWRRLCPKDHFDLEALLHSFHACHWKTIAKFWSHQQPGHICRHFCFNAYITLTCTSGLHWARSPTAKIPSKTFIMPIQFERTPWFVSPPQLWQQPWAYLRPSRLHCYQYNWLLIQFGPGTTKENSWKPVPV